MRVCMQFADKHQKTKMTNKTKLNETIQESERKSASKKGKGNEIAV